MEQDLINYFLNSREYVKQKEIRQEEIDINLMFNAISKFFNLKDFKNVNLSRTKEGLDQIKLNFKWDEEKEIFIENNCLYCLTIDKLDNCDYQIFNKYYYSEGVNNQIFIQKALVDIKNSHLLAYINYYDNGIVAKVDCRNIVSYNIISGNAKLKKILGQVVCYEIK